MKKTIYATLTIAIILFTCCAGTQETENTTTTTHLTTTTTQTTTTTSTTNTTTTTTTTSTSTTTTTQPKKTVYVNITANSFNPYDIRINRGDTVVWINMDKSPHTVTSEYEPMELDSGGIQRGGNYTHTFNSTGFYSYQCDLHPKLKGRVVVVERDADKPAAQTAINNTRIPPKTNKPVAY